MNEWAWAGIALAAVVVLILFRRVLGGVVKLLVRSGLGMVFLWLFQGVGAVIGVPLGVNFINGAVLALLGVPGFALLLMTQWLTG